MWRPRLRNRDGTPIDPVPVLVVILTGFLVIYAWGPLYFVALGVSVGTSLVLLTVLFLAIVIISYHQLVWTYDPDRRRVRRAPSRGGLEWIWYAIAIGIALMILLALPFVR